MLYPYERSQRVYLQALYAFTLSPLLVSCGNLPRSPCAETRKGAEQVQVGLSETGPWTLCHCSLNLGLHKTSSQRKNRRKYNMSDVCNISTFWAHNLLPINEFGIRQKWKRKKEVKTSVRVVSLGVGYLELQHLHLYRTTRMNYNYRKTVPTKFRHQILPIIFKDQTIRVAQTFDTSLQPCISLFQHTPTEHRKWNHHERMCQHVTALYNNLLASSWPWQRKTSHETASILIIYVLCIN